MKTYMDKEIVSTFSWCNSKYAENNCREVIIKGRKYLKAGKLQSVTFCGVLYKVNAPSVEPSNNHYLLLVGMAKQNPKDRTFSRELAEEVAMENAFEHPTMKIRLSSPIDKHEFAKTVRTMYEVFVHKKLRFVKTKEELS